MQYFENNSYKEDKLLTFKRVMLAQKFIKQIRKLIKRRNFRNNAFSCKKKKKDSEGSSTTNNNSSTKSPNKK